MGSQGQTTVAQAERAVKLAHQRAVRAAKRESAARAVLAQTREYTKLYGAATGRWTRLVVGRFAASDVPTVMRLIDAESEGDRLAHNASSGCAGLLQLHPCWYSGKWSFDPYTARLNLSFAREVRDLCGWGSWSTY